MKKRNLLTLILSVALLGVNLNVNAMKKRNQPDKPFGQSRRQEKRPRRERPAAQPILTQKSIQKLQLLDQEFRVFLHDLEDFNSHVDNDGIRFLFDSRIDVIRMGVGVLTEILNKTRDRSLIQFLEEINNIFSETTEVLNKAYHVGANPGIINSLLEKAENIKKLITEIITIQNSAPIIEDLNEDQASRGQRNAPSQPAPMQQDDSGFDSSDDEADVYAYSGGLRASSNINAFEHSDELNLGIDRTKLNILFKRLVQFYKKLEALSKQQNDFLRKEVIAKEYLPFFKKKINCLVLLSKRSSSIDTFYSAFKDLEQQIAENQISQTLELLHEDEDGNSLLNRTIYLSNKVQDLLKRNYSHSQKIEDEFSDVSDSEVEGNNKNLQEKSVELIQSKIQKYKNLRQAKSDERNLAGIDLSGLDLSSLNLTNKDFTGANFRNANLSNTKFNGSNLTGTIFESAILEDIDLSKTNITQVNFTAVASWKNVKLDGVKEAQGVNLSGLNLQGFNFADEADFTDAILNDADLTNASLNGANLLRTQLNKSILNGAKLNKSKFNGAKLKEAKLHKAELREAVVNDSDLSKAEIIDAKVERINIGGNTYLNDSILSDLHFDFATLKDLRLGHATIINTVFFKSTFCNISLNNSFLYNVAFEKTTLNNINLSDSVIEKFTIKNVQLMAERLHFTSSKLTECFFIGKVTENKDKRKAFFKNHTIEDHHKFYSDSDFEKIYSLMKFCDFTSAKLKNVYFSNILFGLWPTKISPKTISARENLGNISTMESVIFSKTYFYKLISKEGILEFNKTKDWHEKFATMLRHKGAVVNEKISEAYKLYLENQIARLQNSVSSGMSNDIQGWVNTGANALGNLGTGVGSSMQGYAALKLANAQIAALLTASNSGLGTAVALGGDVVTAGGLAALAGGAAANTAAISLPAVVATTAALGCAAAPAITVAGVLASAAPILAAAAVL